MVKVQIHAQGVITGRVQMWHVSSLKQGHTVHELNPQGLDLIRHVIVLEVISGVCMGWVIQRCHASVLWVKTTGNVSWCLMIVTSQGAIPFPLNRKRRCTVTVTVTVTVAITSTTAITTIHASMVLINIDIDIGIIVIVTVIVIIKRLWFLPITRWCWCWFRELYNAVTSSFSPEELTVPCRLCIMQILTSSIWNLKTLFIFLSNHRLCAVCSLSKTQINDEYDLCYVQGIW